MASGGAKGINSTPTLVLKTGPRWRTLSPTESNGGESHGPRDELKPKRLNSFQDVNSLDKSHEKNCTSYIDHILATSLSALS